MPPTSPKVLPHSYCSMGCSFPPAGSQWKGPFSVYQKEDSQVAVSQSAVAFLHQVGAVCPQLPGPGLRAAVLFL